MDALDTPGIQAVAFVDAVGLGQHALDLLTLEVHIAAHPLFEFTADFAAGVLEFLVTLSADLIEQGPGVGTQFGAGRRQGGNFALKIALLGARSAPKRRPAGGCARRFRPR